MASAVEISRVMLEPMYPDATHEELTKGAEFLVRAAANGRADELLSDMDKYLEEIERNMFGPGDHSARRAPSTE